MRASLSDDHFGESRVAIVAVFLPRHQPVGRIVWNGQPLVDEEVDDGGASGEDDACRCLRRDHAINTDRARRDTKTEPPEDCDSKSGLGPFTGDAQVARDVASFFICIGVQVQTVLSGIEVGKCCERECTGDPNKFRKRSVSKPPLAEISKAARSSLRIRHSALRLNHTATSEDGLDMSIGPLSELAGYVWSCRNGLFHPLSVPIRKAASNRGAESLIFSRAVLARFTSADTAGTYLAER